MTDGEPRPTRPCVNCGGLPDTKSPDWNLLLGKRDLPSASVLLTPETSPTEGVSFLVKELLSCAPHSLEILQASEAQYPLMMPVPLSHNNLQILKLVCSGASLTVVDLNIEVGFAAPQRKALCLVAARTARPCSLLEDMVLLADFLHAQAATKDTWRAVEHLLSFLMSSEEALRFDKWPEALGSVLSALMEWEFDGGKRPGDSTVLQRLTANTVDMPQALVAYCHCGE